MVFLTGCYGLQLLIAWRDGQKRIEAKSPDGDKIEFNLFGCIAAYDGGLRNIWVFLILALILPVFMNSLSGLVRLLNQERTNQERSNEPSYVEFATDVRAFSQEAEQAFTNYSGVLPSESNTQLVESADQLSKSASGLADRAESVIERYNSPPRTQNSVDLLYFFCLASIGVLITLEFSYLHTLRISAQDWTPMLLSALVLDLLALLVLVFVVQNPENWNHHYPTLATVLAVLVATVGAMCSSFLILLLARTAGVMHDGQVDLTKIAIQGRSRIWRPLAPR